MREEKERERGKRENVERERKVREGKQTVREKERERGKVRVREREREINEESASHILCTSSGHAVQTHNFTRSKNKIRLGCTLW